jgi:hypothetical protein
MNQHVDKIKTHFQENKKVYVALLAGVVVGAIAVIVVVRELGQIAIIDSYKIQILSPTTNNIMQNMMERRGHPGFVVRCVETGEKFSSQNHAASEMNLSGPNLSQHLNGMRNQVGGFTFERLGEAVAT